MIKTEVTIINKLGLHARASAKFVSTANQFQSRIDIIKEDRIVNGKSIMGVMSLAAHKGTQLTFHIDGPDAEDMNQALIELIQHKFHEKE
jgi:phosphocarrier protein